METVITVLSLVLAILMVVHEFLYLWKVIRYPNNDHQEPEGILEIAEQVPTEDYGKVKEIKKLNSHF